jgi:hypothetical protein
MPGDNLQKPGFKNQPLSQEVRQKAFVGMVKEKDWDKEITVLQNTRRTTLLATSVETIFTILTR